MNKDDKKVLIERIRVVFASEGVIIARLTFLNSEDLMVLKKRLWLCGINFMFVKNSLAKIVANESNLNFLLDDFSGTIVAFYSNDLFSLMKNVSSMINDYPEFFVLLCGKYLNEFLSFEFIKKCSSVSNVQSLYVQLLLTMLYPVKDALRLMKKPVLDCSRCLKISVDKQS